MRAGALLLLLAFAAPAQARPSPFWGRVADPDGEQVDALVDRARLHLDPAVLGGVTADSVARAQALLDEALARKPRHYPAALLRGEALSAAGRASDAVAAIALACTFAAAGVEDEECALRLALEESRAGRYDEALARYQRHILGGRAEAGTYTNAAELLMALGRLPEAVERYREALRLAQTAAPLNSQDTHQALACYGLAVALDRLAQTTLAREAMARAVGLDPRMRLLDAGNPEVFFVPAGDVHYYRGLALELSGRGREAIEAFQRFTATRPRDPFAGRAAAHLTALGASAAPAPAPAPAAHGTWRIVAAATVRSDGPIPAPLIDAAWKSRPRLCEPCFESAPPLARATLRLALDLTIDAKGVLTKVTVTPPPAWTDVPACLQERLTSGLRLPKPTKPAPTSARVELVLAWR